MRIIELNNIDRKDIPLYYRNKYSASAKVELRDHRIIQLDLVFAVEVTPISGKEYCIENMSDIEYPTIPVKKALLEEIRELDRKGLLP